MKLCPKYHYGPQETVECVICFKFVFQINSCMTQCRDCDYFIFVCAQCNFDRFEIRSEFLENIFELKTLFCHKCALKYDPIVTLNNRNFMKDKSFAEVLSRVI